MHKIISCYHHFRLYHITFLSLSNERESQDHAINDQLNVLRMHCTDHWWDEAENEGETEWPGRAAAVQKWGKSVGSHATQICKYLQISWTILCMWSWHMWSACNRCKQMRRRDERSVTEINGLGFWGQSSNRSVRELAVKQEAMQL